MKDGIIKGNGTSRLIRANLPASYEEFRQMAAAGTLPLDLLFNAAGWSQQPDFLNKANLLTDAVANQYGLDPKNATPNAAFEKERRDREAAITELAGKPVLRKIREAVATGNQLKLTMNFTGIDWSQYGVVLLLMEGKQASGGVFFADIETNAGRINFEDGTHCRTTLLFPVYQADRMLAGGVLGEVPPSTDITLPSGRFSGLRNATIYARNGKQPLLRDSSIRLYGM